MNKIKYTWLMQLTMISLVSLSVMFSCTDKELLYVDQPGIYIDKENIAGVKDSTTYSFAEKADDLEQDTVFIPVKISGFTSSVKRKVPLVVDEERTTAKEGVHFRLIESWIDANSITSKVPVLVKRATDLKEEQVKIYLKIVESEDFPFLIGKTKTNDDSYDGEPSFIYSPGFLIKLNDQLLKPDTWDASGSYFKYYFGDYSDVKWKFIIDVTGRTVWGPRARDGEDAPTYNEMSKYYAQIIKALYEYEKENGTPLLDEFGNKVVLPII